MLGPGRRALSEDEGYSGYHGFLEKMVNIRGRNPGENYYLSNRLHQFLMKVRQKIQEKDQMVIGLICGDWGSGKSIVAQKWAHAVSPTLSIQKIAFDKKSMIKAVILAKKEGVIADEGASIFFGRGAMTKEGRLMAELANQIRQKNLFILICIKDPLAVDSMILRAAKFIAYVWENEDQKGQHWKGNVALYPAFRGDNYMQRLIIYLKVKNANPLIRAYRPAPWLTEKGNLYGENHKPPFYAVEPELYLTQKNSILQKYEHALENKIAFNKKADYEQMDKLLERGIKHADIAVACGVSQSLVSQRKMRLKAEANMLQQHKVKN